MYVNMPNSGWQRRSLASKRKGGSRLLRVDWLRDLGRCHGGHTLSFPKPADESQRLAALRALNILDTAPETAYDEIAKLAAQICDCPIGYISFVDDKRRWLRAKYGLPPEIVEAPRETAVCSTTICGPEVLAVPDMTQDWRFARSSMVVGDPHCRFYCGMPLTRGMRRARSAS
jgi:hypothetical protein